MNLKQKKLLSTLITKNYKKYVNIAKSYTHNFQEAEDIVADTYLYICRRSYKDPVLTEQTYEGYFISALICRCINYTKKIKIITLDNITLDSIPCKEHIQPLYISIEDLIIFSKFFCGTKKKAKAIVIKILTDLLPDTTFMDLEDKEKLSIIKDKIKKICQK